jgi:hypothetical protein
VSADSADAVGDSSEVCGTVSGTDSGIICEVPSSTVSEMALGIASNASISAPGLAGSLGEVEEPPHANSAAEAVRAIARRRRGFIALLISP